jgi:hypothetical protein
MVLFGIEIMADQVLQVASNYMGMLFLMKSGRLLFLHPKQQIWGCQLLPDQYSLVVNNPI